MNRKKVLEQIERAGEYFDVLGEVSDESISLIEKELDVKLPESYKWYVKNYGMGGIGGVEIYRVGLNNRLTCVERTNYYREVGLPIKYVVIQHIGEWVYCLDTERMANGECPVVDWDSQAGTIKDKADSFYSFLYEEFELALGTLAEDGLI